MGRESASENSPGRRSKVARLIDEYELEGIGDALERAWTAEGEDRRSLRDLADDFNEAVLTGALEDAGVQTLSGEVENLYRLLAGDDVTTADRTRARRRLERNGVDVEALLDDFVSYQAIRTYLTNTRGATYETDEADRLERTKSTVRQLRSRLVTVSESKLERLDETGDIDVRSPAVMVDVRGACEECGRQFSLDDLEAGTSCDCPPS